MKYECDMISDLLPLYKDGICSEASKKIIEEHLAECPACGKMLNDMNDDTIDEKIVKEKNEVIDSQAKFFKKKSALAGSIVGGIFCVPILVCLIVNLATGAGLTWFFIVLAAILVAASLIVVPLMVPKNKLFTTMTSFTAAVILLLAVCCIYSGGNWFFVAATATLFGLTMLFAPFLAYNEPVKEHLGNHKGLAIMGAYTATFALMMTCIGLHTGPAKFFPMALSIAGPLIAMAWGMFASIRYLKANALVKIGGCFASYSVFGWLLDVLVKNGATKSASLTGVTVQSNSLAVLSVIGFGIAALLIILGIITGLAKGGKKNA